MTDRYFHLLSHADRDSHREYGRDLSNHRRNQKIYVVVILHINIMKSELQVTNTEQQTVASGLTCKLPANTLRC